jgi:formamidopyrimidine-DNA glycosylase
MPELPEVETIARGLQAVLPGRRFTRVSVAWRPMVERSPLDVVQQLPGRRIERVGRRGKYVVITLRDGAVLLVHLKMSGRLYVGGADETPDPYCRVAFDLDDGAQLRFRDPRKFGRVYLTEDVESLLGRLGPEPLDDDFTETAFLARLARRRGRVKSLLLDQTFIAGVGNIYADEALFAARIRPLRRAESLTEAEGRRLYAAVRCVLARGIRLNGATLRDGMYRGGSFQTSFCVYSRTGEPCPVCGTAIERARIGQRSAHYCPVCQQ